MPASNCPPLADILTLLTKLDLDPETQNAVDGLLGWFIRRIEQASGLYSMYIMEAGLRMANNQDLGTPPGFEKEYFTGEPRRDLLDVVKRLHDLDGDGTAERLWSELLVKSPDVFGAGYRCHLRNKATVGADLQAKGVKTKGCTRGKLKTDPKDDARIANAWETGAYKTYADCAKELQKPAKQVEKAIDRHRKRTAGKRRRHNQAPE
jgi:hypothetical protein